MNRSLTEKRDTSIPLFPFAIVLIGALPAVFHPVALPRRGDAQPVEHALEFVLEAEAGGEGLLRGLGGAARLIAAVPAVADHVATLGVVDAVSVGYF